jgi:hypothetical protein
MGQRSTPGAIQVRILLRSGAEHRFEISDQIYGQLDALVKAGADGAELCKEWLPHPMIGDPPVAVDVTGTLEDGTAIDVSFGCTPDSTPPAHSRPPTSGDLDMAPD